MFDLLQHYKLGKLVTNLCMTPHVFLQRNLLNKAFAANCTTMGPFPCMNPHVSLKTITVSKAFSANTATIWSYPTHYCLQCQIQNNVKRGHVNQWIDEVIHCFHQ